MTRKELEEICEDACDSIELRIVVDSIPASKKKQAIKLLKKLMSKKAYESNKAEHEAEVDRRFGQDECPWCGVMKPKSSQLCHTCWANR